MKNMTESKILSLKFYNKTNKGFYSIDKFFLEEDRFNDTIFIPDCLRIMQAILQAIFDKIPNGKNEK